MVHPTLSRRPLAREIHEIEKNVVVFSLGRAIRDESIDNKNKDFILNSHEVLRHGDHIGVSDVDGLRQTSLKEANSFEYLVHPESTKMYQDLRQLYW